MTAKDLISYWLTTANDDFDTAERLLQFKKYHHCLFFCHLALEKLLKGLVYRNIHTHAQPIHNLVKLASQAKIDITTSQKEEFKEITSWNIQARYDSIKRQFYKKASPEFTLVWFKRVKKIFLWLKNQY